MPYVWSYYWKSTRSVLNEECALFIHIVMDFWFDCLKICVLCTDQPVFKWAACWDIWGGSHIYIRWGGFIWSTQDEQWIERYVHLCTCEFIICYLHPGKLCWILSLKYILPPYGIHFYGCCKHKLYSWKCCVVFETISSMEVHFY